MSIEALLDEVDRIAKLRNYEVVFAALKSKDVCQYGRTKSYLNKLLRNLKKVESTLNFFRKFPHYRIKRSFHTQEQYDKLLNVQEGLNKEIEKCKIETLIACRHCSFCKGKKS